MNNYDFSNTRFVLRETLEDFFTTLKQKLNYPADTMFRISDLDIVANDIEQGREETRNSRVIETIKLRNYSSGYHYIENVLYFNNISNTINNINIFSNAVNENFENVKSCYINKTRQFIPNFMGFSADYFNILTPEKFFNIFPNINNIYESYSLCTNLTGSPACGPNVTNMYKTYFACTNLTGSPACGPNVTDMHMTYYNCTNLTGSPVCGSKVNNMSRAYVNCYNLTGSPACGPNVTNMEQTYYNCYNLTGSPICGPNVTDMYMTYENCYNLTGSPACGPNVTGMSHAYYNCTNLTGDFCSIGLNKLTNASWCFYNSNISNICLHDKYINCDHIVSSCYDLNLLTYNIDIDALENLGLIGFNYSTIEDCEAYFYFNDYSNPGYKWKCYANEMRRGLYSNAYLLRKYEHIRED